MDDGAKTAPGVLGAGGGLDVGGFTGEDGATALDFAGTAGGAPLLPMLVLGPADEVDEGGGGRGDAFCVGETGPASELDKNREKHVACGLPVCAGGA
jgi:hypothetical protein